MSALHFAEYNATLRWLDMGHGPTVLFLPGLSMPVLPGFAAVAADPLFKDHRRILLDYLGSGQSDHPQGFDYTMQSHTMTILRVLDYLGIDRVDVVGHSMGGTVGIALACAAPDRVSRLIVGEGNVDPGGGVMSRKLSSLGETAFFEGGRAALLADLRDKAKGGATWADRLLSGWQQADAAGLFGNAKALVDLSEQTFDQFAALPMPKAFVLGEKSLPAAPTPDTPDPDRLKARGIHPLIVPDAGHAMMLDNLPGFVDVLRTALTLQ